MEKTCESLLRSWCGGLLKLQVRNQKEPGLRGGILCPSCGMIHGRCFDAIYPFLYLADRDGDEAYLEGARLLYEWAEQNVSRQDGSYVNDINSQWKGTTVFSVLGLAEALSLHGRVLGKETCERWKSRLERAADFLEGFKEFEVCNVNYRIACCLAMEVCADLLGKEKYRKRGRELARLAVSQLTGDGILAGEGRPVDGVSPRGCRPVDVGYNLEESLPAFFQYAVKTGDAPLREKLVRAWRRHLLFMLDDGAMDNSFGTRNYKWTYWGSRTSDGCGLGCLLAARWEPDLGAAAFKNLSLLSRCTFDGLLYGGPHLKDTGEPPCVHHTFTHAKALAGILDQGLWRRFRDGSLPRSRMKKAEYVRELDTLVIPGREYTATVTAYDWEYPGLPGGHPGGGTLSLLWHRQAGPVLCAGMSRYSLKEPYNMTLPRRGNHRCITPRLELCQDGEVYSNMFDHTCGMEQEQGQGQFRVRVRGRLTDIHKKKHENGEYQVFYLFEPDRVCVQAKVPPGARWILPLVSRQKEEAEAGERKVTVKRDGAAVTVARERGRITLPRGLERIYNLVPGVEALELDMEEEDGEIAFCLSFDYDSKPS